MVFFFSPLIGLQNSLFAAQKPFFDNSKARGSTANPKLALQAQTVGSSGVTPRWELEAKKRLNSRSEPPFPPSGGMFF
jgi:hypothetical protein